MNSLSIALSLHLLLRDHNESELNLFIEEILFLHNYFIVGIQDYFWKHVKQNYLFQNFEQIENVLPILKKLSIDKINDKNYLDQIIEEIYFRFMHLSDRELREQGCF